MKDGLRIRTRFRELRDNVAPLPGAVIDKLGIRSYPIRRGDAEANARRKRTGRRKGAA